jgi:L-fuculose-phosphate aldolase
MNISEIKQAVYEAGIRMSDMGLVAGTWGNISARVDENYMVVTPSGMNYHTLKPENMVVVNIKDLSYEGNLKPSVETPLHAAVYKKRPTINAVIHNHSTNACVVAAAQREIPPILDDMVQIIGGSLRVAKYALPGTDELVDYAMDKLEGRNAVLLANHGPVCLGRSIEEAFVTCLVVEKAARVFIDSQALGGAVCLKDEDVEFMHKFFLEKYGQR